MTSIGASAQIDYLIESMINPNKAIKENYHSIVVTTDDGKVFNGIKVRQDNNELVLRDAEDRLINISLKKIEEQKNGKSLMPEGMVFVPFCYVEAAANILTNPALDPYGKIPEFKYCAARVQAVT